MRKVYAPFCNVGKEDKTSDGEEEKRKGKITMEKLSFL